jgi:hypothetical protein
MMLFGYEFKILPKIERPELALVVIMLGSLVLLVIIILLVPLGPPAGIGNYNETSMIDLTNSILKSRTDLLTIIITAFGAWVGAGAAYFFGRENLKQATEGMLHAIDNPLMRLQKTMIKDIYPFKIDKTFKKSDLVEDVYQWLKSNPKAWFIPILDNKGCLDAVIHEEAVYRYKLEKCPQSDCKENLEKLVDFINQDPQIRKETSELWIKLKMDDSLGTAENVMTYKNARLAIIVDKNCVPTHFITTGDIRRFLLK